MAIMTLLSTLAFVFAFIVQSICATPIVARQACTPDNTPDCNAPPETTVYICEKINWQLPCYLFRLSSTENGATYNWKANQVGSPWPDKSWTIGSFGPAKGMNILIQSQYGENSTMVYYPGLANVGEFWSENLYEFFASWDPRANNNPVSMASRGVAGEMVGETFTDLKEAQEAVDFVYRWHDEIGNDDLFLGGD